MTQKYYEVWDGEGGYNASPEDVEVWKKKMADHQKRLKEKPSGLLKGIPLFICAILVISIIIGFLTAHYFPNPEQRDTETILNDTLQMNAGDLSRDSVLDSMKQSPVGREYDSLIKRRAEQ